MRPNCPAVCKYRVTFENGEIKYPNIPGSVDIYTLANNYAKEHGTTVISVERLL